MCRTSEPVRDRHFTETQSRLRAGNRWAVPDQDGEKSPGNGPAGFFDGVMTALKARPTEYDGVQYRSKSEAIVAMPTKTYFRELHERFIDLRNRDFGLRTRFQVWWGSIYEGDRYSLLWNPSSAFNDAWLEGTWFCDECPFWLHPKEEAWFPEIKRYRFDLEGK